MSQIGACNLQHYKRSFLSRGLESNTTTSASPSTSRKYLAQNEKKTARDGRKETESHLRSEFMH